MQFYHFHRLVNFPASFQRQKSTIGRRHPALLLVAHRISVNFGSAEEPEKNNQLSIEAYFYVKLLIVVYTLRYAMRLTYQLICL